MKYEVIYFKKLLSFIVTLKKKKLLFPFPSTNLIARDEALLLCCHTSLLCPANAHDHHYYQTVTSTTYVTFGAPAVLSSGETAQMRNWGAKPSHLWYTSAGGWKQPWAREYLHIDLCSSKSAYWRVPVPQPGGCQGFLKRGAGVPAAVVQAGDLSTAGATLPCQPGSPCSRFMERVFTSNLILKSGGFGKTCVLGFTS